MGLGKRLRAAHVHKYGIPKVIGSFGVPQADARHFRVRRLLAGLLLRASGLRTIPRGGINQPGQRAKDQEQAGPNGDERG
jgi:hypothetical protein